jgi:hypothetical protein
MHGLHVPALARRLTEPKTGIAASPQAAEASRAEDKNGAYTVQSTLLRLLMTTRRHLFKAAAIGGAAIALPAVAAPKNSYPAGKLCVLVYGKSRRQLPAGAFSSVVTVDLPSLEVQHIASPVSNLHGLLSAGPNASQVWGLGHTSPERMEVFDRQMKRLDIRQYPGFTFRGHGISWREGVLVSAERTSDPMAGGLLLELDVTGRCIAQHSSGGLRPHEIVVCGDYFAVAHYGDRPRPPSPQLPVGVPSAKQPMLFDTVSPGVSFLRRDTLEVAAFYALPGDVAITHLGTTADGQVLAMGINTARVPSDAALYALSERDGATLLSSEWYEKGYEVYSPLFRVDPLKGIVATISEEAARMRRGQSFAHDAATGLVIATFAASQTLFVQMPGRPDRWLNTLELGVPNPRGCAVLPGTPWVAVSGNDDNVAILDASTGRVEKLVGLALGGHSHMFWVPA